MRLVSRYSRWCSTKAGSRAMRSRTCSLHAELRQRPRVIGPVLAHLDPEIEMQALTQSLVELFSRLLADALEARTLGADHDGLLPGAVHPHHGVDDELTIDFTLLFDFDRDAIGQLFHELVGELLAD